MNGPNRKAANAIFIELNKLVEDTGKPLNKISIAGATDFIEAIIDRELASRPKHRAVTLKAKAGTWGGQRGFQVVSTKNLVEPAPNTALLASDVERIIADGVEVTIR